MKIYVSNRQSDLRILKRNVQAVVKHSLALENATCDEVSVTFISDEEMRVLHADAFDDPSPTDCISFPIDGPEEEYRVLGDVFVCPAAAIAYVEKHGGSVFNETILYVVHGLLHLLGYDDMNKKDKAVMRKAEKKHMESLFSAGLIEA